ncbi:MAG: hypothetical protein SGI88_09745 [Candidatus Hydrogenedentes bacterium]|nr:hypothetical protein [Candidatus Hydrogenedentota bacterium]
MDIESPAFVFPCKHIRSKEMYYQSSTADDDPYASGIFWCTRTHETFGPDGEPVEKSECRSGRRCFEE